MSSLTKQQELVYDRLKDNYQTLCSVNVKIGDRVSILVGGGTGLMLLFGASKAFSGSVSGVPLALLVAAAVASLVVFAIACRLWSPFDSAMPGSNEFDDLWEDIVSKELETAYATVVNDIVNVIGEEQATNETRAKLFRYLVATVWVQIMFVLASVLLGT